MFEFYGRLTRAQFVRASAVRIVLFAASVVVFPFLFVALAQVSGCQGVGGACGALELVVAIAVKPLAFVLFVFSFAGISVRRVRDIGPPGWLGLLFAADWQFLVTTGAPWSLAFWAGILSRSFPVFTLLGLTGTAILCAVPSGAAAHQADGPSGHAGFPASESPSSPSSSIAISSAATIPVRSLMALALVPTAIAFKLGVPDDVSFWLALMTWSVTMFLPTLALYFALLLGLHLAVTRRNAMSAGILVLALLPFADWGYEQWSTARAHEQEAREIAAIPTTPVAHIPATLVWESSGPIGLNAIWTIPAIQHVIAKSTLPPDLGQVERPPDLKQFRFTKPTHVASLPDEYLLLKLGRVSGYAKRSLIYSAAGGPFELRHVHSGQDDLVAVWYRAFNPHPSAMPLLTLSGWYRGPNTTTSEEINANFAAFLASALPSSG
jgi:uncharacterized membrane protein YhaH (DUF805 family)